MSSPIASRLVQWYRRLGRDLPWRRDPNPYRVWVSEVMLQQTTVATAGPYFERFIKRFPTARALAAARERDVLAHWSGLGYYHRARNMLAAAKLIIERHAGRIPADMASLRALPGIGPYTAGAILSIGHNLPFPALDGNIMRVAARLGAIGGDPSRASTRRDIEELARRLIPEGKAAVFNQALMDLGAMVCSPRRPSCEVCPVAALCLARREGLVDRIPPSRDSVEMIRVELAAIAVRQGGIVLLVERGEGALMKGMWEFPLLPASTRREVEREASRLGARVIRCAGRVRHTITRHRIVITVYEARPARRPLEARRPAGAAVPEPAARLATPASLRAARWAKLDEMTRPGAGGVALTGAARKISRLLLEGPTPRASAGRSVAR